MAWFIAAVFVAMLGSYLYLKTADRIYEANSQLQIKKTESDPSSFLTGGMDLFGFDKVNVENDIAVLTSQHIFKPSDSPSRLTNTSIYYW